MPVVATYSAANRAAMAGMEKDIQAAIKTLEKLTTEFTVKEQKKMLRPGAIVLRQAIAENAPRSEKAHQRYSTAKLNKKMKAPKGMGTVAATYDPGNLGRSIAIFSFRRSDGLHVGPKLAKGGKSGHFSAKQVDGYYAHWVEYGTINMPAQPYIRPALATATSKMAAAIKMAAEKKLKAFERKHAKK